MDEFMSHKHNVDPPVLIDTMAEREAESDSITSGVKNTSVEEELTNKYGEGDMHIRKCDTCNYEQVIHSAGVHVSGGSMKVYAEADEFSCPNCEDECGSVEVNESTFFDKEGDGGNSANDQDLTAGNAKNADLPKKESKTPAVTTKNKRRSNVEKSLDVVFQKFQDASETDFLRLQKLEEIKIKKEHEFRMQQTILENQRRREEREHEMQMLRMMMGYQPETRTQVYTTHQQQQQPIRNNNIVAYETNEFHIPYNENSSSSCFSGYRSVSANRNATTDDSNSYFEL